MNPTNLSDLTDLRIEFRETSNVSIMGFYSGADIWVELSSVQVCGCIYGEIPLAIVYKRIASEYC